MLREWKADVLDAVRRLGGFGETAADVPDEVPGAVPQFVQRCKHDTADDSPQDDLGPAQAVTPKERGANE